MFYLEKRDGFARKGRLEVGGRRISTPYMINVYTEKFVEDFGKAPYPVKLISEEIYEKLKPKDKNFEVLTGLSTLSPRDLVKAVPRSCRPVYATAAATPASVSFLIYLGVDLVDNVLAIAKAYEGIYFLEDIEVKFEKLRQLPCSCKYCRKMQDLEGEDLYEAIAGHNTEMLKLEVEKCKVLIEREELRNYVESKVKLSPEYTAALRMHDSMNGDCCSRFKRSRCYFSTLESFFRFEVKYFLSRSVEIYDPKSKVLLLLPCTAKKPYLTSKTHRIIRSRVKINVNEIIVSSPLVVPRELELVYPAVNYDTPVTGVWSEEEINFVASWLRKLVEKGEFEKIVAHVEGGYKKVVEKALRDYDVIYTAENGLFSKDSFNRLKRELEGYGKYNLFGEMFRHMSMYQFGISFEGRVKGKYPNLELFDGDRIARVDIVYGQLDVYGKAVEKLLKSGRYIVRIADFEPSSTIFAAGVEEAWEGIRPNDIVVFRSDEVLGVGRAVMSGKEMVECDKGVAIKVKRKIPLR